MTATEKINKMLEVIESGKIIYISTCTKSIKIDRAALKRFEKGGHTLLKAVGNSMFVASGNKFLCIDYCSITVQIK